MNTVLLLSLGLTQLAGTMACNEAGTESQPSTTNAGQLSAQSRAEPAEILEELTAMADRMCACGGDRCRQKVLDDLQSWSIRHGPSSDQFSEAQRRSAEALTARLTRCIVPSVSGPDSADSSAD